MNPTISELHQAILASIVDSGFAPTKPGLGCEIDWDLVQREHVGTLE